MNDVLVFVNDNKGKRIRRSVSLGDTFEYSDNVVKAVGNVSTPPVFHTYTVYEFIDRNMNSYLIGIRDDRPDDSVIQKWIDTCHVRPI